MHNLEGIVAGFEALRGAGRRAALATVTGVCGSAYRRPGARMLIGEDGRTWGGVSGGCLERDVARRGRVVIESGVAVTCRYQTSDDEDLAAGLATGCRGTVDLFIEPLSGTGAGDISYLADVLNSRGPACVATVIRASAIPTVRAGARMVVSADGTVTHGIDCEWLAKAAMHALHEIDNAAAARIINLESAGEAADLFIERIVPRQPLIIFGNGPDVTPVITIARTMGWLVTVVTSQSATGARERFSAAHRLLKTGNDAPLEGLLLSPDSAVVLMTHNFPRDLAILSQIGDLPRYLGILGPRQRTEELLSRLPGHLDLSQVFAPVGLDLGAETPEAIALSIVAEIQAIIAGSIVAPLREKNGPIHSAPENMTGVAGCAGAVAQRRTWCPT
jgi:xanthine dehydrogenase accessory factor